MAAIALGAKVTVDGVMRWLAAREERAAAREERITAMLRVASDPNVDPAAKAECVAWLKRENEREAAQAREDDESLVDRLLKRLGFRDDDKKEEQHS